jgi:addiction module RelE/StbE family toxin
MEVRWSPEAADDLEQIVQYIQTDSPEVARTVAAMIMDAAGGLSVFPNRGRVGRMEGTRELVLDRLPWIAVYRVRNDAVEIVRIYHGAQGWP